MRNETKATAIKIANPSIQAWERSFAGAVLTERTIDAPAATNRTFMVKSSRLYISNYKKPGGSVISLTFVPKTSRRAIRSYSSLLIPLCASDLSP